MRIDEAFRRVGGGYWWVIGLLVVLPALGAASYGAHQDPLYSAVARVQMSGGLAGSNVEADAATQLLLGVVTTPSMVEKAMTAAGIPGDPVEFAARAITVTRVGVSAVNDVAVVTTNPDRSIIALGSLVQQALSYSNVAHQSDANAAVALGKQITALTKERDSLIAQLSSASPGQVLTLQARIAAAAPTLADLLRQRSDLLAGAPSHASIGLLDGARVSATPLPAKVAQLAALGALAGLLLSLGVVAVAEAVRPRVRGRRWVATELGTLSLGHLARLDLTSPASATVLRDLAASAALILRRSRSTTLLLLPVDPRFDWLAARVARELETLTGLRVEHRVDALHPVAGPDDAGPDRGCVVVIALSGSVESLRRLEELREKSHVMGWSLAGTLTFRRPGWWSRLRRIRRRLRADRPTAAHVPLVTATNERTPVAPSVPDPGVVTTSRGTS